MAATARALLPFDVWPPGILAAATPANDNSLRNEVLNKNAISFEASQPGSPVARGLYVLISAWGDEITGTLAIYISGTWYYWTPVEGMIKTVGNDTYRYDSGTWQAYAPGNAAAASVQYTSDTGSTADSDPGAGLLKWNNATQASATEIYVDDDTADGVDLTTLFGALVPGGFLYLQDVDDQDTWQIWEVTSVTDATGYVKIGVSLLANGGSFADGADMLVTFEQGALQTVTAADISDATTVGRNILTQSNPGAVRFNRINADNSVSQRTAAQLLGDIGGAPADDAIFTGDHAVSEADFETGVISPAQITGNVNDYAPTGFSTSRHVRINSAAARMITGLAGGASGRRVTFYNVGSFDILFSVEDTGSSAGNRFAILQSYILQPNRSVDLWYDGTSSRWRLASGHPRACLKVLPSDVVNNNAVANTLEDVTDLYFAVITGKTYRFRFKYAYDSAATATGSRWSVNGPTVNELYYWQEWASNSTSILSRFGAPKNTYNTPATSGGTSELSGNFAFCEGVINSSADGNVIGRFASEVSGSAITARGGLCYVEYECIN